MAVPVTATVITFNEAANIKAALESLSWADELIVVDSESTDDTVAIARQFTDRVIVRAWPGYVAQKNFAAEQASHDWIFSLDADERVSPALASEIRDVLKSGGAAVGYRVPRQGQGRLRSRDRRRRVGRRGRHRHEGEQGEGRGGGEDGGTRAATASPRRPRRRGLLRRRRAPRRGHHLRGPAAPRRGHPRRR